jgi:lysozyme
MIFDLQACVAMNTPFEYFVQVVSNISTITGAQMSFRVVAMPASFVMGACVALVCYVHAETSDGVLKPLTDEPSRGLLFQEYQRDMASARTAESQPFAFPSIFQFAQHAIYDVDNVKRQTKCAPAPETCPIFGIDISHYEPNFPISDLASKDISFIYMKATQGTNYFDNQFGRNWQQAGALAGNKKIPRGAYHFLSSDPRMSGKAQADSFVNFVNSHGGFVEGDLLPALDLEWDVTCQKCPDRWQTRQRNEIVQTVHEFLEQVRQRTKRTPIIYTNKVFLAGLHISDRDLLARPNGGSYKVWIFDLDSQDRKVELPNPGKNLPHVLWQFSFTGKFPGYPGAFDVNVYKGTMTAFKNDLLGSE